MSNDFPINRFHFWHLVEYIRDVVQLPEALTDEDTGIEFYQVNTISKEELIHVLESFNELDNLCQSECQREFEQHVQLGVKSFQVEPSWVEIAPEKVTVGYVGIYVNTEICFSFRKDNAKWIKTE